MKSVLLFITLLLVAMILSSCASLTKEECLSSDWQVIGERDGAQGHEPQNQFQRHITACNRANVTPDHVRWNQGYQLGLFKYCTPTKGLIVGQEGKSYHNVCPPQTEPGFVRGYVLGNKHYSVTSRINTLDNKISFLDSEIDTLITKVGESKPSQTATLQSEISEKRFEMSTARSEKEREIYRLSRIEQLVGQFRQNPQMAYDSNSL